MNDSIPIFLNFGGAREAELALEMLRELGYPCGMTDQEGDATIHVHVDNQDIVSALEIAQAYGGNLVNDDGAEVVQMYDYAYKLNEIPIPAHLVNEDIQADHMDLAASQINQDQQTYATGISEDLHPNTLASDEDLNGFDAGVHL